MMRHDAMFHHTSQHGDQCRWNHQLFYGEMSRIHGSQSPYFLCQIILKHPPYSWSKLIKSAIVWLLNHLKSPISGWLNEASQIHGTWRIASCNPNNSRRVRSSPQAAALSSSSCPAGTKNGTLTTDQRWQFRTQPPWLGHGDFMFDEGLTNKNQSWQVENPRGLAMEVFPFAGKIIYRWWIFQQATPLITGGFSGLTDKHWHRTQNMAFSPTQRGFLLLQNMMILLTRKGYWASSCKVVFS